MVAGLEPGGLARSRRSIFVAILVISFLRCGQTVIVVGVVVTVVALPKCLSLSSRRCLLFLRMSSRLKSLNPWVGTRETARTSARRYANHKAPRRAYTPSIPSYSPGTSCMRGPFSALHGPGMQQATVTVERGRTQVRSRETHKFTRWVPYRLESSTGLGPSQNMPEVSD